MANNLLADLPKFESGTYSKLALNDLVVFAVYFLSQRRKEITAEDIVAGCFSMFPDRFSLRGYAQWPDSTVVNKRWLDCRDKGLISGSTAKGFSITSKGLALAEITGRALKSPYAVVKLGRRVQAELRTRAGRFIRALENSDAYRTYQSQGKIDEISEFDFRSMLLCTMESSAETLRNNLEQYMQFAKMYERAGLVTFLTLVAQKFASILRFSDAKEGVVIRGGMVPKFKK